MCRRFDPHALPAYNNPIVWLTSEDESDPSDHITCQNVGILGEAAKTGSWLGKAWLWLQRVPWDF